MATLSQVSEYLAGKWHCLQGSFVSRVWQRKRRRGGSRRQRRLGKGDEGGKEIVGCTDGGTEPNRRRTGIEITRIKIDKTRNRQTENKRAIFLSHVACSFRCTTWRGLPSCMTRGLPGYCVETVDVPAAIAHGPPPFKPALASPHASRPAFEGCPWGLPLRVTFEGALEGCLGF